MIELRSYVDRVGRNPFERWYEKLESSTRARIAVMLDRLSRGGMATKGVGLGVQEVKVDLGPGFRVYFGKDGEALIILLGGGTKRRQEQDIQTARQLWREYKQRKSEP